MTGTETKAKVLYQKNIGTDPESRLRFRFGGLNR